MTTLYLNFDVDDIERATRFYLQAFDLQLGRRLGDDFQELLGAQLPIYLIKSAAGTPPYAGASSVRAYTRHWTPVHVDLVVSDIRAAIHRALDAGARLERDVRQEPYGLLALLSDPFGHGFCFLQLQGEGYDAIKS